MTDVHDLISRNAEFAARGFNADLTINPSGNMMVVGCVDPLKPLGGKPVQSDVCDVFPAVVDRQGVAFALESM
jgi:hypothetical protein